MHHFRLALDAQMLKLRRTPSVLIVLAAPALVNAVLLLILATRAGNATMDDPWRTLAGSVGTIWVLFMLPLLVATVTALWANFEHDGRPWQHLFVLAVPRASVYAAKWVLSLALVTASTLLLGSFSVLVGAIVHLLLPGLGFPWPPPIGQIATQMAIMCLASGFVVTIHTWVSLRFSSMFLALGVGLAFLVANLFVSCSATLSRFFPWSLPLRVHAMPGVSVLEAVLYSILGGAVVAVVGTWDPLRRDHL